MQSLSGRIRWYIQCKMVHSMIGQLFLWFELFMTCISCGGGLHLLSTCIIKQQQLAGCYHACYYHPLIERHQDPDACCSHLRVWAVQKRNRRERQNPDTYPRTLNLKTGPGVGQHATAWWLRLKSQVRTADSGSVVP